MTITAIKNGNYIDGGSGSLVIVDRYSVVGDSGNAYTVSIEVSGDSGFAQGEQCTCPASRFSRAAKCKHVLAVEELRDAERAKFRAENPDEPEPWEA